MITEECESANHAGCSGYVPPENDPELCECECHDELARQLFG